MKRRAVMLAMALFLAAGIALAGCSEGSEEVGTLEFKANGEDFVRQGFVSKDGWSISFDHVYVSLSDITAYQTDPPYDPHSGAAMEAEIQVGLDGDHTVDLAVGGEDALPILVGSVQDAVAGHYNAISWGMIKASSGPAEGYSLIVIGTAEKEDQSIDFAIRVEEEYEYSCGEFVGDERKGILQDGGTADVEMTFHFDHIFGDAGTPPGDALNIGAVGFAPFAEIAESGSLDIDVAGLHAGLSAEDYQMLVDILPTLGHVGEGHCHCH